MTTKCLSNKYLWKCGSAAGFARSPEGALLLPEQEGRGIFISQTYDSGEKDMQWNRLHIDITKKAVFVLWAYVFHDREEGVKIDLLQEIGQKYEYITQKAQIRSNYSDCLLYGANKASGRYIKLCLEVLQTGNPEKWVLEGYDISFPKENFVSYLPGVYRDNAELEKYMAVLQNLYLETEQDIDDITGNLDYEHCTKEQAVRLGRFMGYTDRLEQLDRKTLMKLQSHGAELAAGKGTRQYYEILARILTGQEAVLIEEKGKWKCTLLFKGRVAEEKKKYLEWIIGEAPVGIEMKTVILHPTDRLDEQCFLDYTASVSEKQCVIEDGGTVLRNLYLM